MLFQAILLAAYAAFASAQITQNPNGTITCPANAPNGDFCAGESLGTNIIVRCNNGVGQPGNCNDNLDGEPPFGDTPTSCWQTSDTSGDAACVKNCVVYCGSGGCTNGTWTLPASLCTPTYTASTSSASSTSTSSTLSTYTTSSASSYTTSTYTTTCTTGSTTTTETFTTTIPCTTSSTYVPPSNGTTTTPTTTGSATNTPTGPSTTSSAAAFTGAAAVYHPAVGGSLAGLGLVVAYFL